MVGAEIFIARIAWPRWVRVVAPWIFGVFAVGMTGFAVWSWWEQRYRMAHRIPVPVVITSSYVQTETYHNGVSWEPKVEFLYQQNGVTHRGTKCLPTDMVRGLYWWAHRVVRENPPGAHRTGYVVAGRRDDSFLLAHYAFDPYELILFGLGMCGATIAIIVGARLDRIPAPPIRRNDGWYEPARGWDDAVRARSASAACAVALIATALICGHYYAVAWPDYEWFSFVVTGGVAATCVILL